MTAADHPETGGELKWHDVTCPLCQAKHDESCVSIVPGRKDFQGIHWERRVAAANGPASDGVEPHPENHCHRCLGPNVSWSAPSPLWNAVIGYPDQAHDGIVCPPCFAEMAEAAGARGSWKFDVTTWPESASLTHIDGRVWDPATGLWTEPPAPSHPEEPHT